MNIFYFFMTLPLFGIAFLIEKNNNNNVNLCKNCKYFLPNTFIIPNYEFALCDFYKKIKYDDNYNYLVTGVVKKAKVEYEYEYCSLCRKNEKKCGKEGKNYIKRN